ncbi:MAG: fumarylacetoacetate hydrolase family protein [Saprospiraceae bacterium]|nr:fumarylacetoacetate hydrolase family protein [Saprospiraceae bacterium]
MTIFCVGRNYSEHAKELHNQIPTEPVIFLKPATAILPEERSMYYPEFTQDLQHEIELIFKFDKKGKSIPEQQAWNYISHVSVGIDFTARDLQQKCKEKSLPWEISKAFDCSALIGKWIPIEEIQKETLSFELYKNGVAVQHGSASDMIFSVPFIVQYLSQFFKINKGDILFTGTPSGVSSVQIGDKLQGFLNGVSMFETEIK